MPDQDKVYTACVIVIGNEILSGRTQDRNIAFIGQRCDALGIQLLECRVIPDREAVIVATLQACREQFDYVFTTGGIGPTHDDITAAAVAKSFGVRLERRQDAIDAMLAYYGLDRLNEARLKMADLPAGAKLIDNPVSGAPGFQMEYVFVFAGVPMIMQAMFDGVVDRLTGGAPMLTGNVMTTLRESMLAQGLERIQLRYPDVSIGSYPFFRDGKTGVNLVMRTTLADTLERVTREVEELVEDLEGPGTRVN